MTRLLLLIAAAITLNACEQHKAEDLPEKLREGKKHGAVSTEKSDCCAAPATVALTQVR